ncbi:hypothetical protein LJE08_14010, partial [Holdemanella sp. DFI.5.55]|uniref:hypothetical protein n=1 Tax=Holdemanella sp. DFI.5.55 TaxID=2885263 RepID=UPI001D09E2C4
KYRLKDLIEALPISMSTYQYWQAKFEHPDEAEEELKSVIKGLFEYFEGRACLNILRATMVFVG